MTQSARMPVVLLWHMHQPQYRDALNGEYVLPWTYLHAIKDYIDMAAHLEAQPTARAVVNFTPVLIEQLEELAQKIAAHVKTGARIPDAVLRLLGPDPVPSAPAERLELLKACLRAQRKHLISATARSSSSRPSRKRSRPSIAFRTPPTSSFTTSPCGTTSRGWARPCVVATRASPR